MNTSSTNPESPDELDRLMSAFFKAQLKHPWPNAPVPTSGAARTATEPSELVAARTGTAPRNNAPAPARPAKGHDNTARARFTLAASVALMLGTCWYMSNGFEPGTRSIQNAPKAGPGMLHGSGADGTDHMPLKTLEKDKAKGNTGFDMGKVGE